MILMENYIIFLNLYFNYLPDLQDLYIKKKKYDVYDFLIDFETPLA